MAKLVEHLNKASTAYGLEISAEKTKLMTNNTSGINTEIKVNGQQTTSLSIFKRLLCSSDTPSLTSFNGFCGRKSKALNPHQL